VVLFTLTIGYLNFVQNLSQAIIEGTIICEENKFLIPYFEYQYLQIFQTKFGQFLFCDLFQMLYVIWSFHPIIELN